MFPRKFTFWNKIDFPFRTRLISESYEFAGIRNLEYISAGNLI